MRKINILYIGQNAVLINIQFVTLIIDTKVSLIETLFFLNMTFTLLSLRIQTHTLY